MTQRELAARLNQNQDTQPQRKAAEAARRGNVPEVQCIHRDTEAAGKLKCSCSQQPVVYACSNPFVFSGYCTTSLPTQPGDGPIVRADGSRVTPADSRFPSFLPMPLRDGETPRPCDVVVCASCPHMVEPPPHIKRLRQLGIKGDYDESGHCDLVNVSTSEQQWVQHAIDWHNSTPPGMRHCYASHKNLPEIAAILDATKCRLLACHTTIAEPNAVEAAAADYPDVKFWVVYHGSQASMGTNARWMKNQRAFLELTTRLPNVWYGTPEPTAPFSDLGYKRFLTWPNTIPFESPISPPEIQDPPVLLIAGRGDVIKARATSVLAAGLIAKQRPITLSAAIQDNASPLVDLAAAAGVALNRQPYRTSAAFREYLKASVSVVLNATMTEAMQYVGLDALSQGRPVVGSQTIRYLPREWQADPNDPRDIARVAMMFLDDYPKYSEQALRLGCEIRDRQRDAYHAAIKRILQDG